MFQVQSNEFGFLQIRRDHLSILPPPIPDLNPLFEYLKMLRTSHSFPPVGSVIRKTIAGVKTKFLRKACAVDWDLQCSADQKGTAEICLGQSSYRSC